MHVVTYVMLLNFDVPLWISILCVLALPLPSEGFVVSSDLLLYRRSRCLTQYLFPLAFRVLVIFHALSAPVSCLFSWITIISAIDAPLVC